MYVFGIFGEHFLVNGEHRQPGRLTVGDFKCRQKDQECFMMALKAWVFDRCKYPVLLLFLAREKS